MLWYYILKAFCVESLRMIYCSYFHSVMSYGIIFWGNSSQSNNMFKLKEKNIIRIITNSRNRDSCRDLFKKLNILPFYSQYVFSLLTVFHYLKQIRSYMKSILEIKTIFILHSQGCHYIEMVFIIWVLRHLVTCLLI
jgi:hypothetical protein